MMELNPETGKLRPYQPEGALIGVLEHAVKAGDTVAQSIKL